MEIYDGREWFLMFFWIWVQPRETIRKILRMNPRRFVTGIGWFTGAIGALVFEVEASNSAAVTALPRWAVGMGPVTLAMSAFTLGLAGVGLIHLFALVFRWAGHLLGVRAGLVEVRAAVAWSWVPLILLGIVAVIAAISGPAPNQWTKPTDSDLYEIAYSRMAEAALAVWAFFLMAHTVGEVHGVSSRRSCSIMAVGTLAIAFLALGVFIVTSTISMLV